MSAEKQTDLSFKEFLEDQRWGIVGSGSGPRGIALGFLIRGLIALIFGG